MTLKQNDNLIEVVQISEDRHFALETEMEARIRLGENQVRSRMPHPPCHFFRHPHLSSHFTSLSFHFTYVSKSTFTKPSSVRSSEHLLTYNGHQQSMQVTCDQSEPVCVVFAGSVWLLLTYYKSEEDEEATTTQLAYIRHHIRRLEALEQHTLSKTIKPPHTEGESELPAAKRRKPQSNK